jgi:hypothetical protein
VTVEVTQVVGSHGVLMRDHHNKTLEQATNDQQLEAYKPVTDNILHCRDFSQTIGPGSAMTLREAAVSIVVLQ